MGATRVSACQRRNLYVRAFTIIELLVVIAILFLLITATMIGLKTARRGADKSTVLNALRQMMTGYSGYSNENKAMLLPGYIRPVNLGNSRNTVTYDPLTQLDLIARGPNGEVLNSGDTSSYVWRLAPYLDNAWATYMADYGSEIKRRYEDEVLAGVYGPGTMSGTGDPPHLGVGFTPSIGYNSVYLGGDNFHGDGNDDCWSPWTSPNPNVPPPFIISATRAAQVLNPATTIVFATCKAVNQTMPATNEQIGYVELRPPWLPGPIIGPPPPSCMENPQWLIDDDNQLQPYTPAFSGPGGMMVDRNGGDKVPTAHLDGSTMIVNPASFFQDPALTGDPMVDAVMRIIAQWSPYYAREHFGR